MSGFICMDRCLCVMVCVFACAFVLMFACMFVLVYACVFVPVIVCVFMLVCLCLCVCICNCFCIHTCVCLCVCLCGGRRTRLDCHRHQREWTARMSFMESAALSHHKASSIAIHHWEFHSRFLSRHTLHLGTKLPSIRKP